MLSSKKMRISRLTGPHRTLVCGSTATLAYSFDMFLMPVFLTPRCTTSSSTMQVNRLVLQPILHRFFCYPYWHQGHPWDHWRFPILCSQHGIHYSGSSQQARMQSRRNHYYAVTLPDTELLSNKRLGVWFVASYLWVQLPCTLVAYKSPRFGCNYQ